MAENKNDKASVAEAAAPVEQVVQVSQNDIVLKTIEDGAPRFYVVHFDDSGQPAASPLAPGEDFDNLEGMFHGGMLMGVPAESGTAADCTFRLDLDRLSKTIEEFADKKEHDWSETIAGPFDVIFDRKTEAGTDVYVVRCNDAAPHQPIGTVSLMTNMPKVDMIKSIFRGGTYLSFLWRTNTHIGFTCYLMNTSAFWKL